MGRRYLKVRCTMARGITMVDNRNLTNGKNRNQFVVKVHYVRFKSLPAFYINVVAEKVDAKRNSYRVAIRFYMCVGSCKV